MEITPPSYNAPKGFEKSTRGSGPNEWRKREGLENQRWSVSRSVSQTAVS